MCGCVLAATSPSSASRAAAPRMSVTACRQVMRPASRQGDFKNPQTSSETEKGAQSKRLAPRTMNTRRAPRVTAPVDSLSGLLATACVVSDAKDVKRAASTAAGASRRAPTGSSASGGQRRAREPPARKPLSALQQPAAARARRPAAAAAASAWSPRRTGSSSSVGAPGLRAGRRQRRQRLGAGPRGRRPERPRPTTRTR